MTAENPRRVVFLAQRIDGFGSRLDSLVIAMALAEHYKADFRLHWVASEVPGWHTMQGAEDVFARSFIDRHWIDRKDIASYTGFKEFLKTGANVAENSTSGDTVFVEAPWFLPDEWMAEAGEEYVRALLSRCFARIAFNDHLSGIVDLAEKIALPQHVAGIHLRAGDVLYGRERFSLNHYRKGTPYQLASHYLEERAKAGYSTIVFGQDEALCRALAKAHGAFWVGDLMPKGEFNALERELLDITLISRCEEVIGGSSAFLLAGAIRGGIEPRAISELYDVDRWRQIVLANDVPASVEAAASDIQKAFSLWTVARDMMDRKGFDTAEVLPIVENALRHDPDNAFLMLVRASLLVRLGSMQQAEGLLSAAAHDDSGSLLHILTHRLKSGRIPKISPISQVCRSLFLRGDKSTPWANACAAIHLGVASAKEAELARDALTRIPDMPEAWRSRLLTELETAKSLVPSENFAVSEGTVRKSPAQHHKSKPTKKQPWSIASGVRWLRRMVK